MGRPREAIDAAVLAAPIGIDRAVEAEMSGESFRAMIVRGFSMVTSVGRAVELLVEIPAVVEVLALPPARSARGIATGAPAPAAVGLDPVRRVVHAPARRLGGLRRSWPRHRVAAAGRDRWTYPWRGQA